MNETLKILISSIVGVFIGWFLGVATEWIRYRLKIYRIKRALRVELGDLRRWLQRAHSLQKQCVKLASKDVAAGILPSVIPTQIFDTYFADVAFYLSPDERFSYNSIYSLIRTINAQHEELKIIRGEISEDETNSNPMTKYKGIIEAAFTNTLVAVYQVSHHLDSPRPLDLAPTNAEAKTLNEMIETVLKGALDDAQRKTVEEIENEQA